MAKPFHTRGRFYIGWNSYIWWSHALQSLHWRGWCKDNYIIGIFVPSKTTSKLNQKHPVRLYDLTTRLWGRRVWIFSFLLYNPLYPYHCAPLLLKWPLLYKRIFALIEIPAKQELDLFHSVIVFHQKYFLMQFTFFFTKDTPSRPPPVIRSRYCVQWSGAEEDLHSDRDPDSVYHKDPTPTPTPPPLQWLLLILASKIKCRFPPNRGQAQCEMMEKTQAVSRGINYELYMSEVGSVVGAGIRGT